VITSPLRRQLPVDVVEEEEPLQHLLVGSAACLYTDLANSTSNKIYAAIGYQPVADFLRYDIS